MKPIGERPTEDWTDELRRTGRVVFPLRRHPIRCQLGIGIVLFGPLAAYGVPHELRGTTADRHALAVGLFVFVPFMIVGIWQFITQRPAITIDQDGIRRGHRKFIGWNDIDTIGPATGPPWARALRIIPRNPTRRALLVGTPNVRNLPELHTWLKQLLEDQHRA